ncbi:hypothetical protein [Microbacterium sp. P02]|uniref:hypothetical protein n=1 Tax=unclassified Microbacterium TaxID=2609290 RepID=UPI00366FBFA4
MSKRAALWIAFGAVHIGVAVLGFVLPNLPMGDVPNVYEPWSGCALFGTYAYCGTGGHQIVGITEPWVYPQLAFIPMALAWAFAWAVGYIPAWAILITLIDAAAFAVLVGRGRSTGRNVSAWFWLAFIALLGPVGMYRLDGVTVPLAIMGCLWLAGRPWIGSMLLAVATWIKVWPAAILLAAVIVMRRRFAVVGSAILVSAVTLGAVIVLGGGKYALGFVTEQTDRGIQLEAPVGAFYLWRAVFNIPGSYVYYSPELLTFQLTGPNVDPLIAVMTPILVIAIGSVAALGALKVWRGASYLSLFPALSLSLVTAFILFNKVGSPQYLAWIAVPLAIGLVFDRHHWWKPAVLGLAIAALTQLLYPIFYNWLLGDTPDAFVALLLTARNALVAVLFVWSIAKLTRVRTRTSTPALARADAVAIAG